MIKLVALYTRPPDVEGFQKHYLDIHLPLVRQYPGLRRLELTQVTGAPVGDAKYHLMAEMYFDDRDAMDAAMASPQGKAVARDLMSFAAPYVTVLFGEVEGE